MCGCKGTAGIYICTICRFDNRDVCRDTHSRHNRGGGEEGGDNRGTGTSGHSSRMKLYMRLRLKFPNAHAGYELHKKLNQGE